MFLNDVSFLSGLFLKSPETYDDLFITSVENCENGLEIKVSNTNGTLKYKHTITTVEE